MVADHLQAHNIIVQRRRLRSSFRRVDAEGIAARLTTIARHSYSVPAPNFIWHLDGTHKLLR